MTEIAFKSVVRSDTLDAVAYFPEQRDLLIRFKRNNAVYLYKDADASLFNHLVSTPHPWSKFREVISGLQYEKLSSGLRVGPVKVKSAPKIVVSEPVAEPVQAEQDAPKVVVSEEKPKRKRAPRAKAPVEKEYTEAEKAEIRANIAKKQAEAAKI